MHKSRSLILMAVAVVAAAVILLPSVAAQNAAGSPTIKVDRISVPATPIKPQIENPAFAVDFTYNLPSAAFSAGGVATAQATVYMVFQCQNGVTITGPGATQVTITPPATASPGKGNFQVSIPRTAPGLTALPCNLKIRADPPNGGTPAVPEQTVPFTVTADYYSVNQVKLASKLKQSGPQKQVPFEMEVTNFGNARTQYTFEIGSEPTKGKWNAILPEVLLLDSPNSGQGSPTNTAVFTVATPFKNGWNNEEGAYQIIVKPSAADDPQKTGNPLTANMLVRVRGVYVPGLEPAILLGAVLGTALLLRMRKDEE